MRYVFSLLLAFVLAGAAEAQQGQPMPKASAPKAAATQGVHRERHRTLHLFGRRHESHRIFHRDGARLGGRLGHFRLFQGRRGGC